MPRARIKPNPQLKQIVLEETNDGRDVVRFLKSTFMQVEDGVSLFGLRHKDYARTHKIAAARILARIGLEEGKRYLRRTYVRTPFKRVHPEDENDPPRREIAASTEQLYRLVRAKTRDGADIMVHFVEIMKGYHPEYKPHLRMAAAKELVRQIEFDYEDEPTPPSPTHTESAPSSEPVGASLVGAHAVSESNQRHPHPVHPTHPVNPDSDSTPTNHPHPENPVRPVNPDSDKITTHHTNHSSDTPANSIDNSKLPIPDSPPRPHHDYAREHCAEEEESIYQSIIRRSSDRPTLDDAKFKAAQLIADFNRFAADRDPGFAPITVPDQLLTKSLTQRMEAPESYVFDPADYYDLDRDDFYFCLCRDCDECEELEFFEELLRDLEEETDPLYEDP